MTLCRTQLTQNCMKERTKSRVEVIARSYGRNKNFEKKTAGRTAEVNRNVGTSQKTVIADKNEHKPTNFGQNCSRMTGDAI